MNFVRAGPSTALPLVASLRMTSVRNERLVAEGFDCLFQLGREFLLLGCG